MPSERNEPPVDERAALLERLQSSYRFGIARKALAIPIDTNDLAAVIAALGGTTP